MLCCAQGKHAQQHKKAKMIHVSFSISALFYYHYFLPKQPQTCATLCSDAVSVSELVLLLQSSSPAMEPAQPRGCPSEGSRVPGSSVAASPSAAWCSSRGPRWREREGERPGLRFFCAAAAGFWEVRYLGSCFSSRCWRARGPTLPAVINHLVAGSLPSLWGSCLRGCERGWRGPWGSCGIGAFPPVPPPAPDRKAGVSGGLIRRSGGTQP